MSKKSAPLRILIIDDEPLIRWSLSETLTDLGHLVTEAGDGAGAIDALGGGRAAVDVVVLDYRLPDSNDLSLLTAIRRLSPQSAVVMMTAYGTPEMTRRAIELGACRVVAKPFEVHEMAELITRAGDAPR
jgi:two-component system response regulator AtoC